MSTDPGYVRQLYAAAEAGAFVLSVDAAQECAAHFTWYADRLRRFRMDMEVQARTADFGGFESAKQLRSGFEGKARQGVEAFQRAEAVAHQFAAAIYKAAGMLEEVDLANAAAQRVITEEVKR